jgi:hypothetical protein
LAEEVVAVVEEVLEEAEEVARDGKRCYEWRKIAYTLMLTYEPLKFSAVLLLYPYPGPHMDAKLP